ncbi:GlxA family transcriptional regulator [Motiliproteus sp. MSK22-1]|uniref:GlxA family transcriptional regulator n=1 Tax=Motiliproteus sp. MSK22-1 TaxID=1897630 RepID=UPI000976C01F|nr:GlxA family transcriptional regulator [Motiliproteus sp. MSK22-1]OMH32819.1 hypothetical protein BGP75_14965 [Motiliproteus sp. MSK22-1]
MKTIAVLAYPGCQVLDVTGPLQAFATANQFLGSNGYEITITAPDTEVIKTNSGISLQVDQNFNALRPVDTLLIAGGSGVFDQLNNELLVRRIQLQNDHCRRLGSVCTGAFLLAATGLLEGLRAVTHWRYCKQLATMHPKIQVEENALFIRDQGIYSSAGVTAGIDLALSMITEDHSHSVAMKVAQELVMYVHRPGGQSQFSTLLQAQTNGSSLRGLLDYIQNHPTADLTTEALAERQSVSPRHLSRLFKQKLGQSPAAFVEEVRLEQARGKLERSDIGFQQIAVQSGFSSADQLRRAFTRKFGISPRQYRERFANTVNPGASV